MGTHERAGATDEWYTPPYVFESLGCSFDIDVASPGRDITPWIPATKFITKRNPAYTWDGFIWMNPPFGGRNGIVPWLDRFFEHGNGIALTPDRTSVAWWQDAVRRADAVLFVSSKIKFIDATGAIGKSPAQGSTLFAVAPRAVSVLRNASRSGLGLLLAPLE
jgi:hypothetical protein